MQSNNSEPVIDEKYIIVNKNDELKKLFKNIVKNSKPYKTSVDSKKLIITPKAAELGLAFLGPESGRSYYGIGHDETGKIFVLLKEITETNAWENKECLDLFTLMYSSSSLEYIKLACQHASQRIYQQGYYRRSFRAPTNAPLVLHRQIKILTGLIDGSQKWNDHRSTTYYDLPIAEQIRYDGIVDQSSEHAYVWAEALDADEPGVFEVLQAIIFNDDPEASVTSNILVALLSSHKIEAWQLVEKLLLSAQRQEGLRQVIFESLDHCAHGALNHFINVILENKLYRFSSVVRAIGTWTGLGWEAEKTSTITKVLELAKMFLENPEQIEKAIKSKDNLEVYMGLWAKAVVDVEKTKPLLKHLLETGSNEKKSLALHFINQIDIDEFQFPLYRLVLGSKDLQVFTFAMRGLSEMDSMEWIDSETRKEFFRTLHQQVTEIPLKKKDFIGKVFNWLGYQFSKDNVYFILVDLIESTKDQRLELLMKEYDDLGINVRENLCLKILGQSRHSLYQDKKDQKVSKDQKKFALRILHDRGEVIQSLAIEALMHAELISEESTVVTDMFTRKGKTLRASLLKLTLKQKKPTLHLMLESLIESKNLEQRLAGLELLEKLLGHKEYLDTATNYVIQYRASRKISKREQVIFDRIDANKGSIELSADNGYGIYQPLPKIQYDLPKRNKNNIYEKRLRKHPNGLSLSQKALTKTLKELALLVEKNKNHEYEIQTYGSSTTVLLGNNFRSSLGMKQESMSQREYFETFPLWEVWEEWFQSSELDELDLLMLTHYRAYMFSNLEKFVEKYNVSLDEGFLNSLDIGFIEILSSILQQLIETFLPELKEEFLLGLTLHIFNDLPKEIINYDANEDKDNIGSVYYNIGTGWQSDAALNSSLRQIEIEQLSLTEIELIWNIYLWRQYAGLDENIKFSVPPLQLICKAFEADIIDRDVFIKNVMDDPSHFNIFTMKQNAWVSNDWLNDLEKSKPVIEEITTIILDAESRRGDLPTPFSSFAQNLNKIYGVDRLISFISALGKLGLVRGYIYNHRGDLYNKKQMLSHLIRSCYPRNIDTQELFNEFTNQGKLADNNLVEVAIYAPQWHGYISNYLGWEGLDAGIWWMRAHTKTSEYEERSSQDESEIAKFSTLNISEFKLGAVDIEWFNTAYNLLGKARWKMLYEASKFISDSNGHRRAKLYSDVLTGDLKIREVTSKIKDKRDQDFVRLYGLVPLSKKDPEADVLKRYAFLQLYLKQSKQFGAQRQSSESLAVKIAMENLARNAGYTDPVRLTWAMESEQLKKIFSGSTSANFDKVSIELQINLDGLASLVCLKEGKLLKSIPAKLRKEKEVVYLKQQQKTLREQFKRSRKSLEESMCRGDIFDKNELEQLFNHPVISKHLEKLVFIDIGKENTGFYVNACLIDFDGKKHKLLKQAKLRIAHCTDFHAIDVWRGYQAYLYKHEIKQAFKQVFRELYLPTNDELAEKTVSRRYSGHQVNPKQTLGLLKSRGWRVDYEEGFQKLYREQGFAVKLCAMADWFSPADVEAPTLETVNFRSVINETEIDISDIEPRIFSEVMRDIDLVVSVAHVGGIDPEASHSTIEMRKVILEESCKLFKLNNVSMKERHVLIEGSKAQYSIHLGSGVVHQVPGQYLSILPVHSQHRGKIFLPFLDDDPKTSELISKVLLLARDEKIQDPTILNQIN